MVNVAILGASGYAALDLIRILLRHPEVKITALTSRQEETPHVAELHPSLTGRIDMRCRELVVEEVCKVADCVFSTLPHKASMEVVRQFLERGKRVVDFSADYRLRDPEVYTAWYAAEHTDVEHLGEAVYGLPEVYGRELPHARLVANPGCYPTGAILGLAPLVENKLIELRGIVVDAKSGVSGAGRTPSLTTHFPECNESVSAYNVGRHRHTPEIDQVLTDVAGEGVEVIFTPHLIPMDRGIFTTIYARPTRELAEAELLELYRSYFEEKPFVRVVDHLPATKDSAGTNYCDITVRVVRGQVVVLVCLDNLIKGAAGAAVQNFNLMYGFQETAALI